MTTKRLGLIFFLSFAILLGGCGYYFPHVYDGPGVTIYLSEWQNRTNELGLDSKLYRVLSRQFQKSKAIQTTKNKKEADLILAGEIINIDQPSVSWGTSGGASQIKVQLKVRYILKDLKTGEILWQNPSHVWSEYYYTSSESSFDINNEKEAMDKIIDDLTDYLYVTLIKTIRKQNMPKTGEASTIDNSLTKSEPALSSD